jgi:uncharacterized protein YfaS (alpha-2-macroglobulin family)
MAKLFAIFVILAAACLICLSIQSQPVTGVVQGICRDSKTGQPIDGATVDIDLNQPDDDDGSNYRYRGNEFGTRVPDLFSGVPSGWAQGTQADTDLDLVGHQAHKRTHWEVVTDDNGRFLFRAVTVGSYTVSTDSSGHEQQGMPLAVSEGYNEPITVSMTRSAESLAFDTPGKYWCEGEWPSLGLRGLMIKPSLVLTLERLDTNQAIKKNPKLLLQDEQTLDSSGIASQTVRQWTQNITDADDEGSFYDQIHCFDPAKGKPSPGLYRLTASGIGKGAVSSSIVFVVTDLSVVVKSYGNHMLLHAANLQSGKSVRGLQVACMAITNNSSKILSRGTTDQNGLCTISDFGAGEETLGIVLVRNDQHVAAAQINMNSPGSVDENSGSSTSETPGAKDLRAFIYTDRPVYRPGNLVQIKGISRWYVPGTGFVVPANAKVELDITDAQNTTVDRQFVTCNAFGSWTAHFSLSTEALTGEYTVEERSGGQTGSGTFGVAAYHKPEYQVDVTFDKQRYIQGDTIVAKVKATYYFGAPVSGASGSIDVYKKSTVDGDDDDDSANSGNVVTSKQILLDGNGEATIAINTNDNGDDSGGGDVSDNAADDIGDSTSQASAVVAQGDFSIAAKASSTVANIGDNITVTAVTTNQSGSLLASKRLTATASYDIWKDDKDTYEQFTSKSIITAKDGTADFHLLPAKAGLIDVKFSGTDSRRNVVTAEVQIWVPDKDSDIPAQYADMSIMLDKAKYKPGDIAHVLITTAHPGPDSMVTIEGTTLYKSFIVPLTRKATQFDLPVSEAYAPGVTIAVGCVVDKQYLSSSTSLAINDPNRALTITVRPDQAHYHPNDTANIEVHTSGPGGKPIRAEVSVSVVDTAIFAIMPEPSGTIADAFLPQQGDNVTTSESTDTVYYGDVDKGSTVIDIRKRFPDTALWVPDLITDGNGDAKVSLQLPDNLTTWRATVYGHTKNTMVGKGVGQMEVNKDLTVRLQSPVFLVKGDKSTLIAMVNDNADRALYVKLHLLPGGLTVDGPLTQEFEVHPGIAQTITWPITGNTDADYQPEATVQSGALNDGVQATISSIPHGAEFTNWAAGTALHSAAESLNLNPRSIRSNSELTIRLTPTLASALPPAAEYLSSYPYGSTDATASALIADVTLYNERRAFNLSPEVSGDLLQKAQRAILRTYRLQQDDGGWGWFSTNTTDDPLMTGYATYALTIAKGAGLTVTKSILDAAVKECASLAESERSRRHVTDVNFDALSILSYVLAANGSPHGAEQNLHFMERKWLGDPTLIENSNVATAAIAEKMVGRPGSIEESRRLMAQLWSVGRETGGMVSWTDEYHSGARFAGEYDPDPEATAWALLAAQEITPGDARIDKAARWLAANRNDDHWCGVDATGVTVLALTKYIGASNEMMPNMSVAVAVNGKTAGNARFDTSSVGNPDAVITVPGKYLIDGPNLIEMTKTGTGRLYFSIQLKQTVAVPSPQPPPSFFVAAFHRLLNPPRPLPPTATGYRIKRIYMRLTTRRNFLWEDTVPKPDWQFDQDDSILVRLIIDSTRPGSKIVVNEPVPAGCRIAETSGEYDENWDNWWDYTDVRDSGIVFFVNDLSTGRHEIDYHLIAQRLGEYDVMPTSITSMVDPTLQATGTASKVEIDGK